MVPAARGDAGATSAALAVLAALAAYECVVLDSSTASSSIDPSLALLRMKTGALVSTAERGFARLLEHPSPKLDVHLGVDTAPSPATISYRLAHDTCLQLETSGQFALAADIMGRALAAEAQRTNQRALLGLNLATDDGPRQFQKVYQSMLAQRGHMEGVRAPLIQRPSLLPGFLLTALVYVKEHFGRCFKCRPKQRLPTPQQTLEDLAKRWFLPLPEVTRIWAEFLEISLGSYTLSQPRARASILCHLPHEMQQAVWNIMLLDPSVSDLVDTGDESGGACGAGGLNFEEFLIFRCFVVAECLEDQFRFLWAIFDRDADFFVNREDLRQVLQVPRAMLGWDDAFTKQWVTFVFTTIKPEREEGLSHRELLRALQQHSELRPLLMACEPRETGGTQLSQTENEWMRGFTDLFRKS